MSNASIITIDTLTKRFGDKQVLCIDKLVLRKGAVTGIIGPSGAGKSTLLRILNLLDVPTQGEISYFGRVVPRHLNEKLTLQRKMTMVFQRPALLDMSVYDNIAFGLRARDLSKAEVEQRVSSVLDVIGMASQAKQRAKTLSGGEAQRVAFARALVLHPEILFLDEPTANLDPSNVELLEGLIAALNRKCGTSVLIVTHNLFQAQRLAQDVIFLNQGRLIEVGETQQIFHAPHYNETRAFVEGKMIY